MTEHSPITPPPELVQQWMNEICDDPNGNPQFVSSDDRALAARAAAWGADTELEACCEWLQDPDLNVDTYELRAARRPNPPSLKQQALQELDKVDMLWDITEFGQETLNSLDIIRRAIESIPNPS
jgi:hypothetical protein